MVRREEKFLWLSVLTLRRVVKAKQAALKAIHGE